MLRQAVAASRRSGVDVPLVQADALALPFASRSFDLACSAFGAVPFVADSALLMREVARVLRPGGRWVFSVTHPMRWIFPDDPGAQGLTAIQSYFDRSPYVEVDEAGVPAYVEHHRTLGDRVRELVGAGFGLVDLLEPDWPEDLEPDLGSVVAVARRDLPRHRDLRLRTGRRGLSWPVPPGQDVWFGSLGYCVDGPPL